MRRIVAAVLASILGANALVMLFASAWWYGAVPDVAATGPYNTRFVKNIGAAYPACGPSSHKGEAGTPSS